MRKIILFVSVFYAMAFMASCTGYEEVEESGVTDNVQSDVLSESDALEIVKTFQRGVEGENSSRAASLHGCTYGIVDKYYISHSLPASRTTRSLDVAQGLVYEVSIDKGAYKGKALVSGDKRCPEVIAYIPVCNDSVEESRTGVPIMLQMAKETFIKHLESNETEKNDVASTRSNPVEVIPTQVYMAVVPVCKTAWGQWEPYNNAYPKNWVDIFGGMCTYGHYPTGCAVTAVAQIMAALEPNLTCAGLKMDWAYLKEDKTINSGPFGKVDPERKIDMVAALFKDIYDKTGSSPIWGTGDTDAYPPERVACITDVTTLASKVYDYLNSGSGVTYCSNYQKWNFDVVKNSLLGLCPVFVAGASHAFVVDGYAVAKNESSSINNTYFHACFGWDGSGDGYYLSNTDGAVSFDTVVGGIYDTPQLNILSNIRRR